MNVLVDADYLDSDAAYRLCQLLGNDCADVLPIRLWKWALATNRVDGRFVADDARLAEIVRYRGASKELVKSFTQCGIVEHVTGGLRICGWKRNAKYFKERDRLRQKYDAKKTAGVPEKSRGNAAGVPVPSSSSSSSPLSSKGGGENPPPKTLAEAQATLVPVEQRLELFEHWQTEHERVWKTTKVLVPPSAGLWNAATVLTNAAGDMALAKGAVTSLVETKNGYWHDRQNALYLLTDPRDFDRARIIASKRPGVDDFAARVAEQEARNRAQLEEVE